MADIETKVNAVGSILGVQSTELSLPLRDAVQTIVLDIPASDSLFRTTKIQAGADIAEALGKAVKNIENAKSDYSNTNRTPADFVDAAMKGDIPPLPGFPEKVGDLGIVETVGHIAADHRGTIPTNIKAALKTMVMAGGMSAKNANENIARLEGGEQEIYKAKSIIHDDKEELANGQIDINAAMGPLKDAIEKGLKLDLATHAGGDGAAIAKLPALQQQNQNQSLE